MPVLLSACVCVCTMRMPVSAAANTGHRTPWTEVIAGCELLEAPEN